MPDLVLTDSALESLQSALSAAVKDLEAVQKSLGGLDGASLGAASVLAAESGYEASRQTDLTATGVGISDLLTQVDHVKQQMTEADLRLGNAAHLVISQ